MTEIIRKVPIKGNFYANENGIIYEFKDGIMEPCLVEKIRSGYLCLDRQKYGGLKLVHRLMAFAFLENPKGKEVDHIDRNIYNNNRYNLQVLTKEQHFRKTKFKGAESNMAQYYNKLSLQDKDEIFVCLQYYTPEDIGRFLSIATYCVKSVYLEYMEMTPKKRLKKIKKLLTNKKIEKRVNYILQGIKKDSIAWRKLC